MCAHANTPTNLYPARNECETAGRADTASPRISGGGGFELPEAKPWVGTITILSTSAIQNGEVVCHQLRSLCVEAFENPP